ncbi:Ammonium transporter [Balamuthia mandrillaris]
MASCEGGAINTGDTSLMMMATTFVMLQTPAMGIAQAGLIRRKNSLSMLMQTLTGLCIGSVIWFIFGFALTFGESKGGVIGNLKYAFFVEVPWDDCMPSLAATIPGVLFAAFQMMFALMVPVIVTGSWAEKMNFKAFLVFVIFWPILVYYPLAHWVWNPEGWLREMGVLDFAGGITIHTAAGTAGFVVALILQRRGGFHLRGKRRKKFGNFELKGPMVALGYIFRHDPDGNRLGHHNIPLAVIGGVLIWGGWYSFNGGSDFRASGNASKALLNTHIAACVSGATWVLLTVMQDRKWHLTELLGGAFAGLACVTPGSGFIEPYAGFVVGVFAGLTSYISARLMKRVFDVDDVLDVAALQGAPGIVGSILVGFLTNCDFCKYEGILYSGDGKLLGVQVLALLVSVSWTAFWTAIIMFGMAMIPGIGINITPHQEIEGLDLTQIGEQAYDDRLAIKEDLGEDVLVTRLNEAAAMGDIKEFRELVEAGADPERGDYDGRTAAHLAASEGRLALLEFMARRYNVHLNVKDNFGNTPLDDAVNNNFKNVARWLKEKGVECNQKVLGTRLLYAAAQGNLSEIHLLHSAGVDVDATDYDGRSALMLASAEGHLPVVKYLVAKCKADFTMVDRWRNNAFQAAVNGGHATVAQYLSQETHAALSARANEEGTDATDLFVVPDAKLNVETHQLCAAAAIGDLAELKRLCKKHANPSLGDYDGRTPLHVAAAGGHIAVVKYLVEAAKVNINALDRWHQTGLTEAVNHQHKEIAEYLRARGAVAINGQVGADLCAAAAKGSLEELEVIAKHHTNINVGDYDSRTALHLATCNGHTKIVKWLLRKGCNPFAKDRFGHTPRDDAVLYKHTDIAEILRQAEASLMEGGPSFLEVSSGESDGGGSSSDDEEGGQKMREKKTEKQKERDAGSSSGSSSDSHASSD